MYESKCGCSIDCVFDWFCVFIGYQVCTMGSVCVQVILLSSLTSDYFVLYSIYIRFSGMELTVYVCSGSPCIFKS